MTVLEWPRVPEADTSALRAELVDLVGQIIDGEVHALNTLDGRFARMAAALLALLDNHEPDSLGLCRRCRPTRCDVLETVNQYFEAATDSGVVE